MALLPKEIITKRLNFTKKCKATLDSKAEWSKFMLDLLLSDSSIKWYNEGLKMSEGNGISIVGPCTKISIPMRHFSNIFQAEVYAVSRFSCWENAGKNSQACARKNC